MMPKAWKWKTGLLLGLIVLSTYLILPSLLSLPAKREAAQTAGEKLPWYFSVLPEKGINLGLDLRGGIYSEFEIETDKAIANKVDMFDSDIERWLKKENIQFESVRQDTTTHTIIISGLDAAGVDRTVEYLNDSYSGALIKRPVPEGASLAFGMQDKYRSQLEDQIVKQALEKVRNRIDRYGVAEPTIQRLGSDRIAVELPGIKDPERAVNIIKQAGQLEFKIVDEAIPDAKIKEMVADVKKSGNISDDYSSKTVEKINEQLKGKIPADDEVAFEVQYDTMTHKQTGGVPYLLHRKAEVTGEMLKNAQVNVHNNEPYVSLSFDNQGTALFGETTTKNVGKRMAILLDGSVTKAPVIREPITGGQAQITLGYGRYQDQLKEAEDLSLVLQEGALPAQLTEATKSVVGPSLGADSIHSGVFSTVIGALIVCVFMIIYYKVSGIIADWAMMLNLLFILSALAIFQATLTLPGIAGIALTLGMAVDSNVLINERIREELRLGKTIGAAIDAGYHHAMRAIIDTHLTTLIAGVVLYQFGTGPIKGFAVTLMIGLVINLYTSIVCTRQVYDYMLVKHRIRGVGIR